MFLSLLETIHSSHLLVTAVIAMVGISGIGMYYHWIRLLQFTSMSSVPDMKFGFSPGELNVFFHRLGPRGSEAYQGFCTWDLYSFIPTYTMTGMLLLYRLISVDGSYKFHKTKKPFLLIWLFPAMALSDYVETAIPCYGAFIFPEELDRKLVRMASLGNQGKWVFTALISLVVVYLSLCARQSKKSS